LISPNAKPCNEEDRITILDIIDRDLSRIYLCGLHRNRQYKPAQKENKPHYCGRVKGFLISRGTEVKDTFENSSENVVFVANKKGCKTTVTTDGSKLTIKKINGNM
jgi:hypothetical protein